MAETARQSWTEQVTQIAERAVVREGLELWAVECGGAGKGRFVRIFIDKPGGVTHGDCELISEQVSAMLDVEDAVRAIRTSLKSRVPALSASSAILGTSAGFRVRRCASRFARPSAASGDSKDESQAWTKAA